MKILSNEFNIKSVLEIVYIEEYNTHAYVCENGDIYIQLMMGRCFNRQQFLDSPMYKNNNDKYKNERLNLYDCLEEYFILKYYNN